MPNAALRLPVARPLLRLIMTDDSEHRDTPTDLAPPPSSEADRDTNPPDPIESARANEFVADALRAQNHLSANTMRQLAEHELVKLYRTAIGMHEQLIGASGLLEQNRRNTVEDIARVVDRGFDRVWERVEPRLSRQDGKIDGLKSEVSDLRTQLKSALIRVNELERRLDEHDPAPPTPSRST